MTRRTLLQTMIGGALAAVGIRRDRAEPFLYGPGTERPALEVEYGWEVANWSDPNYFAAGDTIILNRVEVSHSVCPVTGEYTEIGRRVLPGVPVPVYVKVY